MKKLIAIGILILVLFSAWAQDVIYTNQATVAWDAVAPLGGDTITYEVWISDGTTDTLMAETDLLEHTITFGVEGSWTIGVRTVRTITATGERLYSEMNWSDVNGEATPNPFVIRFYLPPAAPLGLRHSP
jgi:hypothetical protein